MVVLAHSRSQGIHVHRLHVLRGHGRAHLPLAWQMDVPITRSQYLQAPQWLVLGAALVRGSLTIETLKDRGKSLRLLSIRIF